tara:strand:- start:774 stop:947 length:174 start_codon:yes stop_codon:yes gene_type:complete
MITAEEREKAFRDDWNKLLIKHGALDEWEDGKFITMFTQWDNETGRSITKEFCEFDL